MASRESRIFDYSQQIQNKIKNFLVGSNDMYYQYLTKYLRDFTCPNKWLTLNSSIQHPKIHQNTNVPGSPSKVVQIHSYHV